jgi:hypothetical protein
VLRAVLSTPRGFLFPPLTEQAIEKAQEGTQRAGGVAVVAGAAACGGLVAAAAVGGLMIPVAAAGAAGYTATRSDGVGDAARATGNAAVTSLAKAKEFEEKNQIGAKLKTIGEGAVAKVNALERLLRESVNCACKCKLTATRFMQAKDVNEKYHVVDNVKVSLPSARAPFALVTHARTHARES